MNCVRLVFFAITLVAFCSSTSRADFVIDDYTNTGDGNTVVSGATVSISSALFVSAEADHYSFSAFTSPTTVFVEYDFGAGTLGDLAGTPNLDILTFGSWVQPADFDDWTFKLSLFDGGTEHVAYDGEVVGQVNTGSAAIQAADADRIRFSYTFSTGGVIGSSDGRFGDFNPDGSVLFANPEPTTMLLFGLGVGAGLIVRRRKA